MIDYDKLPASDAVRNAFRNHIEHVRKTGDFVYAVLCNNFVDAVCRADPTNLANIKEIAQWIYNEAPTYSWGSQRRVEQWKGAMGLVIANQIAENKINHASRLVQIVEDEK